MRISAMKNVKLSALVETLEDVLRDLLELHKQGMEVALAIRYLSQAIEQLEELTPAA
jgi:hypothetical protein